MTARYGFELEQAKGKVFHVGCFSTCKSIKKQVALQAQMAQGICQPLHKPCYSFRKLQPYIHCSRNRRSRVLVNRLKSQFCWAAEDQIDRTVDSVQDRAPRARQKVIDHVMLTFTFIKLSPLKHSNLCFVRFSFLTILTFSQSLCCVQQCHLHSPLYIVCPLPLSILCTRQCVPQAGEASTHVLTVLWSPV